MHDIPKQIPLANNHISVDCVVIGFDGEQLKVLLINRIGEENGKVYRDMKLPGSLIYMDVGPGRSSPAGLIRTDRYPKRQPDAI